MLGAWRPIQRGGVWIGDPECIEMMQAVDAMSPAWRALVYEYGGVIVRALYDECDGDDEDAENAAYQLQTWRERKQAEWLRTDFITPAVAEGFKRQFRLRPAPTQLAA